MMLRIVLENEGGEWTGYLRADDGIAVVCTCKCSGPDRESVRIAVYQEACRLLGEALMSA